MGNDDKFFPDDDEFSEDTVTRKIRMLEERGVLDKPDDQDDFGGTTTITTYPFVQMKSGGRIKRLLQRLKKS